MKNKNRKLLWGLSIVSLIVIAIFVFGNIDIGRNILLVTVFLFVLIPLILFIDMLVAKIPLTCQLAKKQAFFSYLLYLNLIALSFSEFFLKTNYIGSIIYVLFGVLAFYLSYKNYFQKREDKDNLLDFMYTIIIALLLSAIQIIVEGIKEPLLFIILNFFLTILVSILFYLFIAYIKNNKMSK